MNRQEKESPHEFRYSVKKTNVIQAPKPVENEDYYEADKFDCIVAFEIHVTGYDYEDEIDTECRAYDLIKTEGDLECLGVMMKERKGSVCLDMDNKPFDRKAWIKQKSEELKITRKERPLTNFIEI